MKEIEPELQNIQVFKIQDSSLTFLYYPSLDIMNVEYFDEKEDDDFFITIYYENKFHLEESPEKDLNKLESYLNLFKEYKKEC